MSLADYYPQRIICLTEETTETLYLLGAQNRIVGISGFTVRPPQARKEKPKVSTFLDAKIEEILDLKPDLVIGFSDIQADIARDLIKQGITVWVNNHRSVAGILKMIIQLGTLVGENQAAHDLVRKIEGQIADIQAETRGWDQRPKVYFEEWFDPLISGIQWVSELVEIAGGEEIFPEYSRESLAKNRIVKDPDLVIRQNPDIMLASWCGKMVKEKKIRAREGWSKIAALQHNEIHEIKSAIILQPGPAALLEGLPILYQIFKDWRAKRSRGGLSSAPATE
ncbi:MAG TPA: cobalamin-binding protein [Saprospiraceae bacterium]|nr:cobalamin-binding protein [Saprospiraceae bacterium]